MLKNTPTSKSASKSRNFSSLSKSTLLKQCRYTPILTELDTKLKAFIPDYIPAVGEVDAFMKMPRPDGQPEVLGLNILVILKFIQDEPCLNQSDKAKIELMMMNNRKQYIGGKYSKVHSIEQAEKNPKQILSWITSVGDVHKNKQPPTVSYTKPMPDIDSLMQVWPQEVE
jgi:intraflagellar transport protein 46